MKLLLLIVIIFFYFYSQLLPHPWNQVLNRVLDQKQVLYHRVKIQALNRVVLALVLDQRTLWNPRK